MLEAVGHTFDLIEQNPAIGTPVLGVARGRFRRLVVRRLPYHVIALRMARLSCPP